MSKKSIEEALIDGYFEGDEQSTLSEKDRTRIQLFLRSYEPCQLENLNSRQLMVLYHLFLHQDTDTDWLSSALGLSR